MVGAIRAKKALLVIVANDASENTKKLYGDKCRSNRTELLFFGTADGLGMAIGKNRRSAVAITEAHFADELKEKLALLNKEL